MTNKRYSFHYNSYCIKIKRKKRNNFLRYINTCIEQLTQFLKGMTNEPRSQRRFKNRIANRVGLRWQSIQHFKGHSNKPVLLLLILNLGTTN